MGYDVDKIDYPPKKKKKERVYKKGFERKYKRWQKL